MSGGRESVARSELRRLFPPCREPMPSEWREIINRIERLERRKNEDDR